MSEAQCITAALQGYSSAGLSLPTQHESYGETEDVIAAKRAPSAWASVFWMPVDIDSRLQTVDREIGMLQIDLNYPLKGGWAAVLSSWEVLKQHFAPGRKFSYSGQNITVKGRERTAIRDVEDGWQRVSVTVRFAAAVDRTPVV